MTACYPAQGSPPCSTVLFTALALHLGELVAPQLIRPVRGRPRTAVRSWAVYAALTVVPDPHWISTR